MLTVVTLDFGGDIYTNPFTGVSITGRVFAIEDVHPQREMAIYVIPNNVVDIFINKSTGTVKEENIAQLSVYNKNNYTKTNSISNLGNYTIPIVFTDVVQPISVGDNYVSSEIKRYLFQLGMREVAPSIKPYLMQFIAELNKGTITENKLDRVNKFLGYFGVKVKKIVIEPMNDVEKNFHTQAYNQNSNKQSINTTPPAVAPATTGVVIR